jgi:hypothetical protein
MALSRRMSLALGVCSLLFLVLVSVAFAGEPASVTVRVEGFNGTLVPQTTVTTTTAPVPVEGGTCSGTSAGGALYDATQGDWEAKFENGEPEPQILGVDGVDLLPFGADNYAYWALWVNDTYASNGYCGEQLGANADVVVVAQCFALGQYCPGSATAPDHFLTATPPTSKVVSVGEPVSVTVGSLSTATEAAEPLPAGVTVTAGPDTAIPNEHGVATLSFSAAGTYTLQARASDSVPSDPYTICVHNGNDGTCGTQTPGGSSAGSTSTGGATVGAPYKGAYALVPHLTGLTDGHVYTRAHAPRILSGSVLAHTTVSSISLTLRREYRHRCYAFNGTTTQFVRARCGTGKPFKVSANSTFSYLLPSALEPGRYVLDVQATDAAGNRTTLARGTSRIVFYVR